MLKLIAAFLAIGVVATAFSPVSQHLLRRSSSTIVSSTSDPNYFRRPIEQIDVSEQSNLLLGSQASLGQLQVAGQGAVGFKFVPVKEQIVFNFKSASERSGLKFVINEKGCSFHEIDRSGRSPLLYEKKDKNLLDVGKNQTFWMSFDKEHCIVRFGTGYMLKALESFNVTFVNSTAPQHAKDTQKTDYLAKFGDLQTYTMTTPDRVAQGGKLHLVKSKYPVTADLPAIVKDQDALTLKDLDTNSAVSILELSPECQRLYASVAGKSIQLNTDDFPDFSAAIDHSIQAEHGICNQRLTEKAEGGEFHSESNEYDANESYLRITLGTNQGDSPGIPYVMEIWPGGCYSPIHDHANCNAIIKVLHGSLKTRFFAGLNSHITEPYDEAVVSAGDVTWLDDRQFQTHQLFNHNRGGSACVTIQCYLYNDRDTTHYENFDYIGGDNATYAFEPNSDWDFGTFKELIREEWQAYLDTAVPKAKMLPLPPPN